jgi:hypothetical protein
VHIEPMRIVAGNWRGENTYFTRCTTLENGEYINMKVIEIPWHVGLILSPSPSPRPLPRGEGETTLLQLQSIASFSATISCSIRKLRYYRKLMVAFK